MRGLLARIGLAWGLLGMGASAWAQTPPTLSSYQWSLAWPYSSLGFIPGTVDMWFDTTDSAIPGGAPRPVSTQYPMPVMSLGGYSSPKQVTYGPLATTSIAPGTAANIALAVTTGCFFVNTSTFTLTVSLHGIAGASSTPVLAGATFRVPYPTVQSVSVYNPSTSTAATLAGELY